MGDAEEGLMIVLAATAAAIAAAWRCRHDIFMRVDEPLDPDVPYVPKSDESWDCGPSISPVSWLLGAEAGLRSGLNVCCLLGFGMLMEWDEDSEDAEDRFELKEAATAAADNNCICAAAAAANMLQKRSRKKQGSKTP